MTHKNSIRPNSLRSRDCILYVYDMTHEIGKDRIFYALEDRILSIMDRILFIIDRILFADDRIVYAKDRIFYARTVYFQVRIA